MSKTINISLSEELLKEVDKLAKSEFVSRSDFIRETLVRRIKGRYIVDEWGDPAGGAVRQAWSCVVVKVLGAVVAAGAGLGAVDGPGAACQPGVGGAVRTGWLNEGGIMLTLASGGGIGKSLSGA